jgi:hypothetical protein
VKYASSAEIDARYRRRAVAIGKIVKWPAIGALIGGGAILVGYLVGPSVAEQIGARGGAGFVRGMTEAQDQVAAVQRRLSISGWGRYR